MTPLLVSTSAAVRAAKVRRMEGKKREGVGKMDSRNSLQDCDEWDSGDQSLKLERIRNKFYISNSAIKS
jgi:hypothetical protein